LKKPPRHSSEAMALCAGNLLPEHYLFRYNDVMLIM